MEIRERINELGRQLDELKASLEEGRKMLHKMAVSGCHRAEWRAGIC